jgi:predicted MFS family arabinose efflux permease
MLRAAATPSAGRSDEQRLVLFIGAVVFVDTMFYAVIAPLLPGLAHELRLSKLSAGVLTASYAAGMLLGSLPAGVLAARAGPRFTVCAGLALLAGSTVAFGVLANAAALDAARFVEGVGGACTWAGGLAWIAEETPLERRGAMMGRAVGAAVAGALFGPVIGTVATAVGRPAAFSGVSIVAVVLILLARRLPTHHTPAEHGARSLPQILTRPLVAAGMWLVALPAIGSGMMGVLGPLRLHRLGAAAAAIGATFLLSAAIEAAIAPAVGSLSDRRGRLTPLRYGLAMTAFTLCWFTVPQDVVPLALVIILITSSVGIFWAPAMAMLSDAADAYGLDQGLAAALMNLAWAGGQIVGSGGGGAAAKAAGDALPTVFSAGLCLITLAWLAWLPVRRGMAARAPSDLATPDVAAGEHR